MSFLQNIKFSNLKLIAGVFFASVILSACGASDPTQAGNVRNNLLVLEVDYAAPSNLAEYETAEYKNSAALDGVKAAYAYGNIQTRIGGGDTSGKQAGKDQIVSVVIQRDAGKNLFVTTHPEFTKGGAEGDAFKSIYNFSGASPSLNPLTNIYSSDSTDSSNNNCVDTSGCDGSQYAALIVGRKGELAQEIHGVAYEAKIQAIIIDGNEANRIRAIKRGAGADIVAMDYNNFQADTDTNTTEVCYDDGTDIPQYYKRPKGRRDDVFEWNSTNNADGNLSFALSCNKKAPNTKFSNAELTAWKDAVAPNGTNKTIMVFGTGEAGFNSETGLVSVTIPPIRATDEDGNPVSARESNLNSITLITNDDPLANPMDANIANLHAAYPALYTDDDFTSGRWLAVTAVNTVDEDNKKHVISSSANGCGVAMHFCLAAPGINVYTIDSTSSGYTNVTGTEYASSIVAGALAVLQGAYPNASPEQLTRLVLDTATYIPLDGRARDGTLYRERGRFRLFTEDILYRKKVLRADGTTRYINPVYGYGLLNLAAATTPSPTTSYVTASNNESIGVLWQDTSLTLSEAFGSNFESVTFGIGDVYGRHFTTKASQVNHTPVAVGLDDYMSGLLGDNVQSERLGTSGDKAQANYSNSEQSWMNLQYTSGKATSKIAFQESYKIKPLQDMGATSQATSMLRANHIRPASENIGMMDVDYELTGNLSLSSYAARGEYDTGYKFDELGTDFDVSYKKSTLNLGLGHLREHQQFLGTNSSGAYALKAPTVSRFTDVTYGHDVGKKFNLYANYIQYKTDVNMGYQDFATIDNLQANQYRIGFKGKNLMSDDDNLNVALITKLGVTDGVLNQNTVRGYTADGGYNNVSQSYDLAVSERHQQFEVTYQGRLYQNADKVSALKNNRFFTTIRVDRNLNNVQGASQTEIIGGINARF